MRDEEEKDMFEGLLVPNNTNEHTNEIIRISKNAVNKLIEKKTPIVCKDGVVKIDPSHPDYKFWMED